MGLTILNVAYPLARVGPDAVGGAEQILAALDGALVRAGHRSLVLAMEGSQVDGTLIPTKPLEPPFDETKRLPLWRMIRERLRRVVARERVDLVHMHGVDFWHYLPAEEVPTLVTLHLPPPDYPSAVFNIDRPGLVYNCVSRRQHQSCPSSRVPLHVIENGVPVEALANKVSKRRFALALGRICPEKNFHTALDAGTRAALPVLLGGQVHGYREHVSYFDDQLLPRLHAGSPGHRFLGPLPFARKRRLLAGARCLVSASLAAETSSLVAMEALAAGTPVVAYPSGALADLVAHGDTGYLVHDLQEMAEALRAAGGLHSERCRQVARERFCVRRMTRSYLALYELMQESHLLAPPRASKRMSA